MPTVWIDSAEALCTHRLVAPAACGLPLDAILLCYVPKELCLPMCLHAGLANDMVLVSQVVNVQENQRVSVNAPGAGECPAICVCLPMRACRWPLPCSCMLLRAVVMDTSSVSPGLLLHLPVSRGPCA